MDAETIYKMDIIKRIDLYNSLNPEEKIRWSLLFDCNCSVPSVYYAHPAEHMTTCPMHNSNNPNYDYL